MNNKMTSKAGQTGRSGRGAESSAAESPEIALLREVTTAVARGRDVGKLLEDVIEILEKRLGMVRGTVTLLEGDELRIEASARTLNAEERALGRYRIGEGITGLVAKTGRPVVVPDVRKDPRFLNRTRSRRPAEAVSFVCVPLVHLGQVVGTLSADRALAPGGGRPLERDVALLEIVANAAAEAAAALRARRAEREALEADNRRLRALLGDNPGNLVGNCPAMTAVYEQIRLVAPSDATVLVRGPSGTGKELVARAIQSLSPRKDKPFVVLNCAALPESLVESELFGHERGAFTDALERRIGRAEAADGGTLFLDEIGDLPLPVQVKLLRFLQDRTFSRVGSSQERRSDVRFLAATSRDLEDMMARGLFREDLYYRINIFPIALPPLAERGDDVVLLARHFLQRLSAKYGKKIDRISPQAVERLMAHPWPGNVRELENCMERAVLTAQDGCIREFNLPAALGVGGTAAESSPAASSLTLAEQLDAHERRILEAALARHKGNRSAAGRELGVSPRMMTYRLHRLGISP